MVFKSLGQDEITRGVSIGRKYMLRTEQQGTPTFRTQRDEGEPAKEPEKKQLEDYERDQAKEVSRD